MNWRIRSSIDSSEHTAPPSGGRGHRRWRSLTPLTRGLIIAIASLLALGLAGLVAIVALPQDLADSARWPSAPSSAIYDRNGVLLYQIVDPNGGLHRVVTLDEVPESLVQAVIATEDASFYSNPGISPRAILRALGLNAQAGHIVSGGSTITQQVARELLLGDDRYEQSVVRKVSEMWLALRLTARLPKDDILALYLNETYFGNLYYGVQAAAQGYFGKPVRELSLAESAMIAGIPQSPVAYNPLTDPDTAAQRQRTVLELMVRAGYIDEAAAQRAAAESLRYAGSAYSLRAPHFSAMVRDELGTLVGEDVVAAGGLTVYTTLDWGLQERAEQAVSRHLAEANQASAEAPARNVQNAAAVAMEPSGAVRVLVGSADYWNAEISGAVNGALALRQPGSALKPFTYAAAFERGYSPASTIADVYSVFRTAEGTTYTPVNYDGRYHGLVTLREALANSYNIAAVRLLDQIGVTALPDMVRRVGIDTLNAPERQGLALTLGGAEVRLIDLTAAYATLAHAGELVTPYIIERVENAEGVVLYQHVTPDPVQAVDPRVAYLVTDVLADDEARVPAFGRGSALDLPYPAAVKTGTTTAFRDNWTVGYTTDWTVGVWVGNADGSPMKGATGVTGAAPIWHSLMLAAHRDTPQPFVVPSGLASVEVCSVSGMLPGPACARHRTELFLQENIPTDYCSLHELVAYDAATGEPADDETPPDQVVLRSVTHWPPEVLQWAIDQGLAHAQAESVAIPSPTASQTGAAAPGPVRFISPSDGAVYRISSELPAESQQLRISAVCEQFTAGGRLSLEVDGVEWHEWSGPPYTVYWPLTIGTHTFQLEYRSDSEGTTAGVPVSITVIAVATQGASEQ